MVCKYKALFMTDELRERCEGLPCPDQGAGYPRKVARNPLQPIRKMRFSLVPDLPRLPHPLQTHCIPIHPNLYPLISQFALRDRKYLPL